MGPGWRRDDLSILLYSFGHIDSKVFHILIWRLLMDALYVMDNLTFEWQYVFSELLCKRHVLGRGDEVRHA